MKRLFCALLCAALIFGLCGCNNDPSSYVPSGDALDYGDATQPTTSTQEGTELTLTYYPQVTLNPYTCTDFTNRALFSLLYQGLFSTDANYQTEPVLCKRFVRSEDMKSYTFYVENATFSDGTALTSADVVASLLYAKESPVYKGRFFHITEILQEADGGITLKLDTPYENLPLLLDIPIVKAGQLEDIRPLGTGPYALEISTGNARLRRRSDWWCSAKLPIQASVIRLVEAESVTQIRDTFEFDTLDLVCTDPGSDNYADYRCDCELWSSENGIFLYLAFCRDSQVFTTPESRSLLTYAIDRDYLAEKFYRGFARSVTLPASPQFPYYSSRLASQYTYDAPRFAQAVSDAGLEGQSVVFLVNSDDSLRLRVAREIAKMLESGGLIVEMKELGGSAYQYALRSRQFDLYLGQTKLSPNMDLSSFFATYGELSYGGVNDRAAYALCQQALANYGNYYSLHKTVMDNGLLCPVLVRSYAVYTTRGVFSSFQPARDQIFYYSLGKTMEDASA